MEVFANKINLNYNERQLEGEDSVLMAPALGLTLKQR
jgi:hypothetical protein